MSIPFAKRLSDGLMVDASSVPRGRHCGCVCPSCATSLIARQGEVREWHFAHATNDSGVEQVCDYSALVSIRLMSHQVLADIETINLPPGPSESRTASREALIQSVQVDARFEDSAVDAIAQIKGVPLVLFMTYKSRPIPTAVRRPTQKDAGVLEIDLNVICQSLQTSNLDHVVGKTVEKHSSRDMLMRLLVEDTSAKNWIYHPRQDQKPKTGVKQVSIDQLRQDSARPQVRQKRTRPRIDNSPLLAKYGCQNCPETWIAGYDDDNARTCPICKHQTVSKHALPR